MLAHIKKFFSLRAGQLGGFVYLVLALFVSLLALDAYQHHNQHQLEALRLKRMRTQLLDSVARAGEAAAQRRYQLRDSLLTHRFQQQATVAEKQQKRDETIEARYRAGRVVLPAL